MSSKSMSRLATSLLVASSLFCTAAEAMASNYSVAFAFDAYGETETGNIETVFLGRNVGSL
jgi:hypothetical protein